jgi:hypothetical protein
MLANALNTHVILSETANTSDGSKGTLSASVFDNADAANTLFEHRCQLNQQSNDIDSDSTTEDTKYRWVMWYAKGRLIKYRRLDH